MVKLMSVVGVYSITWVFQFLYHLVPGQGEPKVLSSVTKYEKSGVDEATSIILTFPQGNTQGIATCSLRVSSKVDMEALTKRARSVPILMVKVQLCLSFVYRERKEKFRLSAWDIDQRAIESLPT